MHVPFSQMPQSMKVEWNEPEKNSSRVYTDESVMQIKQMLLWGFLLYSL